MCSVSVSEQEPSQIDTVTVTVVNTIVAGVVETSATLTNHVADGRGYTQNVET